MSKTFHQKNDFYPTKWYCKNEAEPGNLLDALRDTGGVFNEVTEVLWDKIRQYLYKLDAEKQNATI